MVGERFRVAGNPSATVEASSGALSAEEQKEKKEDPACLYMMFAYIAWLFLLRHVLSIVDLPYTTAHELKWVQKSGWAPATCKVLAAGLSNRGAEDVASWGFGHSDYKECPGWGWCATEHDQCKCSGDVMYTTPYQHNSNPEDSKFVPDMTVGKSSILEHVGGHVTCSTESFGRDPAPGETKGCWCLPNAVANVVRTKGPLNASECLAASNANYRSAQDTKLSSEARRLSSARRSVIEGGGSEQLLELPDGWASSDTNDDPGSTTYLPWALVEVNSRGGLFDNSWSGLRCAYKYGSELVSREDSLDEAGIYQHYQRAVGSEVNCTALDKCTIALESLEKLPEEEGASAYSDWPLRSHRGVWVIVEFVMTVAGVCQAGRLWSRNDPTEGNQKLGLQFGFGMFALCFILAAILAAALDDGSGKGIAHAVTFLVYPTLSYPFFVELPLMVMWAIRRCRDPQGYQGSLGDAGPTSEPLLSTS